LSDNMDFRLQPDLAIIVQKFIKTKGEKLQRTPLPQKAKQQKEEKMLEKIQSTKSEKPNQSTSHSPPEGLVVEGLVVVPALVVAVDEGVVLPGFVVVPSSIITTISNYIFLLLLSCLRE
jgi:hypothetical protein